MFNVEQTQVNNIIYIPIDLDNHILLSFANIVSPSSACIRRVINVYNQDHHWEETKIYKRYYIKDIMSFSSYYFATRDEPYNFKLGPDKYNNM